MHVVIVTACSGRRRLGSKLKLRHTPPLPANEGLARIVETGKNLDSRAGRSPDRASCKPKSQRLDLQELFTDRKLQDDSFTVSAVRILLLRCFVHHCDPDCTAQTWYLDLLHKLFVCVSVGEIEIKIRHDRHKVSVLPVELLCVKADSVTVN